MKTDYEYPEGKAEVSWWEESVYCSIFWHTSAGHYCGYARFPERPTIEQGYQGILTYVPVHGGITYAREDKDGTMVYGFDCGHADDESNPDLRNLEWLKGECRRMIGAITEAANIEEAYLTARDNQGKADVLDQYHQSCRDHGVDFSVQNNFGAMLNLLGGEL